MKKKLYACFARELAHRHVHTRARTQKLIAHNYVLNHFMNDLVACGKIFEAYWSVSMLHDRQTK